MTYNQVFQKVLFGTSVALSLGFLMISGGIPMQHWAEMALEPGKPVK